MRNSDEALLIDSLPARRTSLGSIEIFRALPRSQRRMVGPWCFLDRYGPISFTMAKPMDVAPHPHMGLQTVSWLAAGEIVHKDSLGYEALMRAGQLNLMTSGTGIAHSEETPARNSGQLEGLQLWVALPDDHRDDVPSFDHYASLPVAEISAVRLTVITGEMLGYKSPAKTFSPIVGVELVFHEDQRIDLPLAADFEHAAFVLNGNAALDNTPIAANALHYVRPGPHELRITGTRGCRMVLIGGEPFRKPVLMWWNFVARTREEMAKARADWERHERFGEVHAYNGPRVPAPEL